MSLPGPAVLLFATLQLLRARRICRSGLHRSFVPACYNNYIFIPDVTASSTQLNSRLVNYRKHFTVFVTGKTLVPSPAAGIMALCTFIVFNLQYLILNILLIIHQLYLFLNAFPAFNGKRPLPNSLINTQLRIKPFVLLQPALAECPGFPTCCFY